MSDDLISKQVAIDALGEEPEVWIEEDEYAQGLNDQWHYDVNALKAVPPAQPEQTDCEFCHVDSDWYVRPIEESSHAVIFGSVLYLKVKGWSGKVQIKFCPMCGRRLER